ncbi:MAG: hypothetical protein JSR77_14715 [Planctomycetes bacterium]|nr:hypothetical protein [Planctomycetota bacterium]
MNNSSTVAFVLAAAAISCSAQAQLSLLFADRTVNRLWRLTDVNNDGVFQNPDELFPWYDGSNADGTPAIQNINSMAYRASDGTVVGGDQVLQSVFYFRDANGNGNALDAGESRVVASSPNGSGIATSFPTGTYFTDTGELLMVNAGNANGADAIYRMIDTDNDGKFYAAGEILPYVTTGAFGAVANGPYSPQEIWLAPRNQEGVQVGFLRNSSLNLHGIFKFVDSNHSNRADDVGEFTPWFTAGNLSGITVSAGFPLEADPIRPGALYTHQIASGGLDQILRVQDLNNDGDANDAGEAVMVYVNSESGFTAVDLVALENGDLLISDNSGKRIYRLHDADNNGLFSAAEASVIFTGGSTAGDVRQMIRIPTPIPCPADFNQDGGIDGSDVGAFFEQWEAGNPSGDVNQDGGTDGADVEYFFQRWSAGGC